MIGHCNYQDVCPARLRATGTSLEPHFLGSLAGQFTFGPTPVAVPVTHGPMPLISTIRIRYIMEYIIISNIIDIDEKSLDPPEKYSPSCGTDQLDYR